MSVLPSTETVMVRITNDLLMATVYGLLSILILLDLTIAFDTVSHTIDILTSIGITCNTLTWFRSHLCGYTCPTQALQFTVLSGQCREDNESSGPHVSVLHLLLFIINLLCLKKQPNSVVRRCHPAQPLLQTHLSFKNLLWPNLTTPL